MKQPFILFILAALTAILCAKQRGGRTIALSAASGNNNQQRSHPPQHPTENDGIGGGGLVQLSDFFSSLIGDTTTNNNNDKLAINNNNKIQFTSSSSGQLASFLQNLQWSLNNHLGSHHHHQQQQQQQQTVAIERDEREQTIIRTTSSGDDGITMETKNRRKVLYELSVRSHYARILSSDQGIRPNHTSILPSSSAGSDNNGIDSCEYYNDGMKSSSSSSFDIRDDNDNIMDRSSSSSIKENSILSRFSHWTYKFCPKKSLSQIHLEPMAITDTTWDAKDHSSNKDSEILKLPPNSILSENIQFLVSTVHDLGSYLSPLSSEYESYIHSEWGLGETTTQDDSIEYYVGGDACNGSMERHSKVIYDPECCERKLTMMDEFFRHGGQVMIRSVEEPTPCRYVLRVCAMCTPEKESAPEPLDARTLDSSTESTHASGIEYLLQRLLQGNPVGDDAFPPMPPSQIEENKKLLRSMFTHAYDSYFYNAFPASELKPLTCKPGVFDLVRVPALTLIDTLDTLIILGNYTEFARSVERLRYLDMKMKQQSQSLGDWTPYGRRAGEVGGLFSVNQNVSVFETTIRVLGGLLSAHQLALAFMENRVSKSDVWDASGNILNATSAGMVNRDDGHDFEPLTEGLNRNDHQGETISPNWEYDGFLLDLAHDVGKRLVYAFDTETGIPYGTVNLLYGVPSGETSVASLAGAGSLSLEFELLSRLTGDSSFGKAAKEATRALWARRSPQLNLLGKHIDVHSGEWTEIVSGVGSNSDSFYEYLIKHYLMFPEDSDFWQMFSAAYAGVQEHSRVGDWYVDVGMGQGLNGHVRQVFESLMAFFPGLQVLLGEMVPSARTANAFFSVREFLGLLPERFDFIRWKTEDSGNVYPLRPELLESCYFLHLASMGLHGSNRGPCCQSNSSHLTSNWLWAADFALRAVNKLSWTPCGFATVSNVGPLTTGKIEGASDFQPHKQRIKVRHRNEMPSYFLSETIKYLFLTFDAENNILHKDNEREWIFTTEAHPIHYVDSVTLNENRLRTQLDQVRRLLKDIISNNSTSSIVDDEFVIGTTAPLNESRTSHMDESVGFIESGPPFRKASVSAADASSFGIFSSEISAINEANSPFDRRGRGRLGKLCPNYHHPDLQWTHALNGESMDYTAIYQSLLAPDLSYPNDDLDQRMLTALSSACFYGTDYYASGITEHTDASCPVIDSQNDMENTKNQRLIPGASRYNMGGSLGLFDVSIYPGADGFIVKHVESEVLLEVSLLYSNQQIEERLALVVLSLPPPRQEYSSFNRKIDFSWMSLNGSWGRVSRSSSKLKDSFDDDNAESDILGNEYQRHVVAADMSSNSFTCLVVITRKESKSLKFEERDVFISSFPCSPAMFGRASVSNLVQQGGDVVEGRLLPPPVDDDVGCKSQNDVQIEDLGILHLEDDFVHHGRHFVQLINRGDCSFMRKTCNYRHHARGIIVINTDPSELFVMSSEIPQPGECSHDEIPVSVLVSGNDGAFIVKLLRDEELSAQIQLTKSNNEFPRVQSSEEVLQVSVNNNWGVQAVSRGNLGKNELQLFIVQPVEVDS